MSAFFLAINRDQQPFEKEVAEKMMSAINVFGQDQQTLVVKDHYAMGYQSHWTVPEEVSECQPICNAEKSIWVLFYGRVDNRDELIQLMGSSEADISDADLMLQWYSNFGKENLAKVIGPFVFCVFDSENGEVFAARDGMGGRNLVYRITDQYIFIATYEMAIVAHPDVDYVFNHSRLARIIGHLLEDRLSSPIQGITPLEPGTAISISVDYRQTIQHHTFYCFDPSKRLVLKDDQAYANQFRKLLSQAINRRLRTSSKVGSMLSGGMDSVPMSIVAAQQLAEKGQTLTAFSWVFDQIEEADERHYSQPVCEDFNIKQVCIPCDQVWPKFDHTTYTNPVMPFVVPYVELQQTALATAHDQGINVILSGVHGDLLYGYTDSILWELLKQKRWNDCLREARYRLKHAAGFSAWFKQYVLRPLPWVQKILEKRRLKSKPVCEWLSDEVQKTLENSPAHLSKQAVKSIRPIAYQLILGGFAGEDIAYGRHIDAVCGVERRYPFRDRDLCEFMLSIPSDQLNFLGVNRPLIKRAFANELRPELLTRNDKTSFYPAISQGISNDKNYMQWFDSEQQNWSFYVKKCYFSDTGPKNAGLDVVRWQCGYYDYWKSVCYDQTVVELGLNNEKNN